MALVLELRVVEVVVLRALLEVDEFGNICCSTVATSATLAFLSL